MPAREQIVIVVVQLILKLSKKETCDLKAQQNAFRYGAIARDLQKKEATNLFPT
jgi:hypothetical protein